FELGAAWLNEAYIVPIVLPGLTDQDLPKPINGINAILVEKNFYGGGCDVSIRVCKLPAGVQICTGHFPDGRERHRTFSIKHIQPDAEDAALITVVRAVGALLAYPVTRARFIVKKGECCSTLKLVCTRKRVPRRKRAAMRLSAERSLAPR
ncbi:MAG: hypothetical protein LBS53_11160, partial [Synergistaceae bacterium]|nr:hypothetical protein [Synergistaceae bacterium]